MVMSEYFAFALKFGVIGLMIVFGALALISFVVFLIRKMDDRWQEREKAREAAALLKEPNIDTVTLVLITAAAATLIKGRFYIRKVRRLLPKDAKSSPWSMQGRAVLHGSHIARRGR
jgi:Na+-transporting methylmalonyl-CoA/oxaloacetate decarboxylase gamma subunit